MKMKFFYRAISIGAMCLAFIQPSGAQNNSPEPPPPPVPGRMDGNGAGRPDHTEIIIRQNGDKDSKINLEIRNGNFFINGKPLEKFDDGNVIIEKRDIDDNGPGDFSESPFRGETWGSDEEPEKYEERSRKGIEKSLHIRVNQAVLGVSSRKSEKGGATVLDVTKGSAAEKAGILPGDIILKMNDSAITSPESLFETVHHLKAGDKVKIGLSRAGKMLTVTAILEKAEPLPKNFNYNYNYKFRMPPMPVMPPELSDLQNGGFWRTRSPKLGIKAQDTEDGRGVRVLEVEDSSAAAKSGLKKDDVILQFEGADVNSTRDLISQLQDAVQKSLVKVKILRGGINQELEIRIPRKLRTADL